MARLYVALIHFPVLDKHARVVTTSVTTLDLGDLARSCRTYGAEALYVVHPVDAMRGLVRRILKHWREGAGASYNPNRTEALERVRLERTLEGVEIDIEAATGQLPVLIATSARNLNGARDFPSVREELAGTSDPYLLLVGTGWGLTDQIVERAAVVLEPIAGVDGYNHLSVRAASSVILDRLLGTR